ncbi:MAG: energy-coupling factor transporter transmembrane component T family protein [Bacteroidota bacterium]
MNSTPSLYIPGSTFFHRLDSRTKLALAGGLVVIAFSFFNPTIPLAVFTLSLTLNMCATGTYVYRSPVVKMFYMIILLATILQGFANPVGRTPATCLGRELVLPFFGSLKLEGVYCGLVFGLRITGIALAGLLYVTTTHPTDMVQGLVKLGVPHRFGFMFLMSLQLMPIASREAGIIVAAQRARGLPDRSLLERLRGLVALFVPLAVGSIERVEITAMTLETRAYGTGRRPTPLTEAHFGTPDVVVLVLVAAAVVLALSTRILHGNITWMSGVRSWGGLFWPLM